MYILRSIWRKCVLRSVSHPSSDSGLYWLLLPWVSQWWQKCRTPQGHVRNTDEGKLLRYTRGYTGGTVLSFLGDAKACNCQRNPHLAWLGGAVSRRPPPFHCLCFTSPAFSKPRSSYLFSCIPQTSFLLFTPKKNDLEIRQLIFWLIKSTQSKFTTTLIPI